VVDRNGLNIIDTKSEPSVKLGGADLVVPADRVSFTADACAIKTFDKCRERSQVY
jgi:hypothetical protein